MESSGLSPAAPHPVDVGSRAGAAPQVGSHWSGAEGQNSPFPASQTVGSAQDPSGFRGCWSTRSGRVPSSPTSIPSPSPGVFPNPFLPLPVLIPGIVPRWVQALGKENRSLVIPSRHQWPHPRLIRHRCHSQLEPDFPDPFQGMSTEGFRTTPIPQAWIGIQGFLSCPAPLRKEQGVLSVYSFGLVGKTGTFFGGLSGNAGGK